MCGLRGALVCIPCVFVAMEVYMLSNEPLPHYLP